jgi:S-adenosyl-L-methionine hydrolase (adenosine-forming)
MNALFLKAMMGFHAAILPESVRLFAAGQVLERANTFSRLPPGGAFW